MSALVLRGGRVLDPASNVDGAFDLHLANGKVAALLAPKTKIDGAKELDVSGLVLCPGFVDLRARMESPADAQAALAGGFTTVLREGEGPALVGPKVLASSPLFDDGTLGALGATAVALSSGFSPPPSLGVLRRALLYWKSVGVPVLFHAEDASLTGRGVLGAGATAARLGLLPVPVAAEVAAVAGALAVVEDCGAALHFNHLSCAGSVQLVREAKAKGLQVTADVSLEHLVLTDESAKAHSLDGRVWPPLRPKAHGEALLVALRDGTLDAVASDHVPVALVEREHPFDSSAPGSRTLETLLSRLLALELPLARAVQALTSGPAKVLRRPLGTLAAGAAADVTVVDAAAKRVRYTLVDGIVRTPELTT